MRSAGTEDEMGGAMARYFGFVWHTCIWVFANFLAVIGLFLIIYYVCVNLGMQPIIADWFLDGLSSYLASLSLLLVCISIYFEKQKRTPPTKATRLVSAPIFIAIGVVFLLITVFHGSISPRFADALSISAVGGALMRLTGMPFDTDDVLSPN
jgi:hypothetical protein